VRVVKITTNRVATRQYELPAAPMDDVDRQSFLRWLFEVIPTWPPYGQVYAEIHLEEWPA
jgi:hypothetical protein